MCAMPLTDTLLQMCVDMLLQHGTEGKPQMLPTAVEGKDVATQCPASKRAQLQNKQNNNNTVLNKQ